MQIKRAYVIVKGAELFCVGLHYKSWRDCTTKAFSSLGQLFCSAGTNLSNLVFLRGLMFVVQVQLSNLDSR